MSQSQREEDSFNEHQIPDSWVIGELAELILEVLKIEIQSESESFEKYIQELRGRSHVNHKIFRERLVRGYEVLLETLQTMS